MVTTPNARYVMARRELDHFSTLTEGPPGARVPYPAFADSIAHHRGRPGGLG